MSLQEWSLVTANKTYKVNYILCNSTEKQTKPTMKCFWIEKKTKQNLTPGFNQATPSIIDFQETHTTISKKKKKKGS